MENRKREKKEKEGCYTRNNFELGRCIFVVSCMLNFEKKGRFENGKVAGKQKENDTR